MFGDVAVSSRSSMTWLYHPEVRCDDDNQIIFVLGFSLGKFVPHM